MVPGDETRLTTQSPSADTHTRPDPVKFTLPLMEWSPLGGGVNHPRPKCSLKSIHMNLTQPPGRHTSSSTSLSSSPSVLHCSTTHPLLICSHRIRSLSTASIDALTVTGTTAEVSVFFSLRRHSPHHLSYRCFHEASTAPCVTCARADCSDLLFRFLSLA